MEAALPTISTNLGYDTPPTKVFTVSDVSFTLIGVQGGRFTMGLSPYDERYVPNSGYARVHHDSRPRHQVTLSSFSIGKYEVTQELWQAVMGSNPSYFKGDLKRPVENVSWDSCQVFIRKLNELTGENFRLPTEAEWEYAARGGQKSRGYLYSGSNEIDAVAWYWCNSSRNSVGYTHPVGQKQPNELGLYDMSGNVWEWCSDYFYSYGDYENTIAVNPLNNKGLRTRDYNVKRGGSSGTDSIQCRIWYRYDWKTKSLHNCGLRLAL